MLLEEGYLSNASRRHRITLDEVSPTRSRLTPRARLLIWCDLSTDVDAALAGLPHDGLIDVVWQNPRGDITASRSTKLNIRQCPPCWLKPERC